MMKCQECEHVLAEHRPVFYSIAEKLGQIHMDGFKCNHDKCKCKLSPIDIIRRSD